MSDRIDWVIPSGIDNPGWIIPAAAWSTGVAFQIVSVAREWWSNRAARQQRRQSEMSDWKKVMRGEVKRGYRFWLEPRCCPYSRVKCHSSLRSRVENNGDYREEDAASVCMVIRHRMPNAGQYSTILRRYSIISPSVYTDVAEVVSQYMPMESGWVSLRCFQLDDRTVAMVFKRRSLGRVRAFLIDVKEKSSRRLEITSPPGIHAVLFMCRDEHRPNRLRIVYGMQEWNRQEMITVDYEIRSPNADPSRLIANEMVNQSITIPGRREYQTLAIPGTLLLRSSHPTAQSLLLAFDHRGNYQIDSYDEGWRKFEASVLGQRLIRAMEDLNSLSPAILAQAQYALFHDKLLHAAVIDVQSPKPACSIVQRHLNVPSMKFLAAEAICRGANPGADLSMIKAETGIDIFDGIIESREMPTPTIRLIHNDEDD